MHSGADNQNDLDMCGELCLSKTENYKKLATIFKNFQKTKTSHKPRFCVKCQAIATYSGSKKCYHDHLQLIGINLVSKETKKFDPNSLQEWYASKGLIEQDCFMFPVVNLECKPSRFWEKFLRSQEILRNAYKKNVKNIFQSPPGKVNIIHDIKRNNKSQSFSMRASPNKLA